MARDNYGERMLELEHHTDEVNWLRNLQDALSMKDSDARIIELIEDGIWFEYNFGEFWKHPKIQAFFKKPDLQM